MKNLLIPGLLSVFLLAACDSGQEPPADDTALEAPVAADPSPADEAVPPADTAEPEVMEVVEESAAEPEDTDTDDVPLILAQADTPAGRTDWQFKEGQHFQRLVPTQPTVGGADKVEVAEFFWYGCNHCNDFEPFINRWAADKPANARFVRIPAMWNPIVKLHAQLYYTEEVLAKNGTLANPDEFHATVFNEFHQHSNRLASESAIQSLFERFGVSADDFRKAWGSFEVAQKMRIAEDLARRYGITGVPAIVVSGKYRTGAAEAGGYPKLLELIDELIARESVR